MADLSEISTARRAPGGAGRSIEGLARKAIAIAGRHRVAFAAGCVVSLVVSFALATKLSTATWDASGTLLYAPLTGPEMQGLYVPPDLRSLVTIAKTPANLRTLRAEFKLKVPVQTLTKFIKVTVPTGTKMVEFELRWGGAEAGAAIVNRLMELFRDQVAGLRKQKINGLADDLRAHHDACKARVQAAGDALDRFCRREKAGDIVQDIARINGEVQALEVVDATNEREHADLQAQLKKMDEHIAKLRERGNAEAADAAKLEHAEESITDNRRRQERLRELIAEEKLRREVQAKLVAARADYQRNVELAKRGVASRKQVETAKALADALAAQIEESADLRAWRAELERIDKVVVPEGGHQAAVLVQRRADPVQAAGDRPAADLQPRGGGAAQEGHRGRPPRGRPADGAPAGVQGAGPGRGAGRGRAPVGDGGADGDPEAPGDPDARVLGRRPRVPRAVPGPPPTRRLILMIGLATGLLATLGALALADQVIWPSADAAEAAWKLGLPILGRLPGPITVPGPDEPDDPAIRLLALRLRQAVDESSGLILFSSMNAAGGSARLVEALARCFGRREERVLILDVAGHPEDRAACAAMRPADLAPAEGPGASAGLHAYLVFECDEPDHFIFPTIHPGVDCMPAGDLLFGMELLATQRMTQLVESARAHYSVILAIGPRADAQVDLELIAAHADAIVLHAVDGAPLCPVEPAKFRHLIGIGAPILGAVFSGAERPVPPPPAARIVPRPALQDLRP